MMVHVSFSAAPDILHWNYNTRKVGRKGVKEMLTCQREGGDDRMGLGEGGMGNEYLGRNKRK